MTVEPADAEGSLAKADVADSATRSVTLWLRMVAFGLTAAGMVVTAGLMALGGAWLQTLLALGAASICVRRIASARREDARVFALAVRTMEEERNRSSDGVARSRDIAGSSSGG
jgi:hypothetical protein